MNRFTTIVLMAVLGIAACQTVPSEPRIEIREVKVPVPVKCAVATPPKPNYADTAQALAAEPDIFGKVKRLLAGREQREAFIGELQAAFDGCRS